MELQKQWLGRIDYISGVRAVELEQKESIFGLEHPLTITLGKRADPLKDIRANVKLLKERGVQIVAVDRGGQATLHNPGQLVIYPHIHLPTWHLGVRQFVDRLEQATTRLLAEFGIVASKSCEPAGDSAIHEPGLFTEQGKIAFFGLRIKNGWSSHGLALNVCNNLEDFNLIRTCGRTDQKIARIVDGAASGQADSEGLRVSLQDLFNKWCAHFQSVMARSLTVETARPMFDPSVDF